jgi:hypothetical protein
MSTITRSTSLDRDWGHITIKISGHPPFPAQVILNGHEYMDRQARKAGILFLRDGNCFTHISDLAGFARIAETLTDESAIGRIAAVCRRWIYSTCVNWRSTPKSDSGAVFVTSTRCISLSTIETSFSTRGRRWRRWSKAWWIATAFGWIFRCSRHSRQETRPYVKKRKRLRDRQVNIVE